MDFVRDPFFFFRGSVQWMFSHGSTLVVEVVELSSYEKAFVLGSELPLFPYIGDKLINPIVGVYIPIIRIPGFPIKAGMTIPNTTTLDLGSFGLVGTTPKH